MSPLSIENVTAYLERKFREKGFIVTKRKTIEGISGAKHNFDMVIENPSSGARVALSVTERLTVEHILLVLATRIDTQTPHIIVAQYVDEKAKEILEKCNILVLSLGKLKLVSTEPVDKKIEDALNEFVVKTVETILTRGENKQDVGSRKQ